MSQWKLGNVKKMKEITFYSELRTHGFRFKMLFFTKKNVKAGKQNNSTDNSFFPKHLIIVLTLST